MVRACRGHPSNPLTRPSCPQHCGLADRVHATSGAIGPRLAIRSSSAAADPGTAASHADALRPCESRWRREHWAQDQALPGGSPSLRAAAAAFWRTTGNGWPPEPPGCQQAIWTSTRAGTTALPDRSAPAVGADKSRQRPRPDHEGGGAGRERLVAPEHQVHASRARIRGAEEPGSTTKGLGARSNASGPPFMSSSAGWRRPGRHGHRAGQLGSVRLDALGPEHASRCAVSQVSTCGPAHR